MKKGYIAAGIIAVLILMMTVGFFAGRKTLVDAVMVPKPMNISTIHTSQVSRDTRTHESYPQQDGYYNMFFDRAEPTPKVNAKKIKAAIVPHHLLVGRYIASAFEGMASKKITRVILISPDHFSQGKGVASTTLFPWNTPFGGVTADTAYINQLVADGGVQIDPDPFDSEHGISGIMPFIRKSFPNAQIVPVIIRDDMSEAQETQLVKALSQEDNKTLLIGSFDFSHYLPHNAAQFHDATSQSVLEMLDHEMARKLDIDSQPGLSVFLQTVKNLDAPQWQQIFHDSSAGLTGDHETIENTSYFSGYYVDGPQQWRDALTMHFFGDTMFDRDVRRILNQHGSEYIFENLGRFLMGSDLVVANLEGTITTNESIAGNEYPLTFTFDPSVAPMLAREGMTDVSLGNNHSRDFGSDGYDQTRYYLKKNGIRYFGDEINKESVSYNTKVRGTTIGWVGFNAFVPSKTNEVIDEIRRMKTVSDVVVVMPHWGQEYKLTEGGGQTKLAHAFIDAGADIVIGAHPHVVQPIEIYKNKPIFYSLGNFVFDQYFSKDVTMGLSVGVEWQQDELVMRLFVLENKRGKIQLASAEKRDEVLHRIAKDSTVSEQFIPQIKAGVIHLKTK